MPSERTVGSKAAYNGQVVSVRIDTILMPDGRSAWREVVEHADAVHILPINNDDRFLLIRQYRAPAQKELLEIPAGGIRPGERPEDAAQRELREETGYRAGSVERVSSFYSTPGFCTEFNHLFFARDLTYDPLAPDFDEDIRVVPLSRDQALKMIRTGGIGDAKSIAALLLYLFVHRPE